MPNLIGLAFTSPNIVAMVLDRETFRVHCYDNKPSSLHAFLHEESPRLPVVLVKGVRDLNRLKEVEGVHSFLLFDDPERINQIEGVLMLDAEPDLDYTGFKKKKVSPKLLNEKLLKEGSFEFPPSLSASLSFLSSDIGFVELLRSVLVGKELGAEWVSNVCSYLVGSLQKRSWISRVQKPGLAAGVSIEKLAELEKFIETSPSAELLWRAYYEHAMGGLSVSDSCAQFEANVDDIEYIISILGSNEGAKYYRNPREKPFVPPKVKTKNRKLAKKKKAPKVISSSVETLKALEQSSEKEKDGTFDLKASLASCDSSLGDTRFSQTVCAYLCGLLEKKDVVEAKKRALSHGVASDLVSGVMTFVKDHRKSPLHTACRSALLVPGMTAAKAAEETGASLSSVSCVLEYKPLAFVYMTDKASRRSS